MFAIIDRLTKEHMRVTNMPIKYKLPGVLRGILHNGKESVPGDFKVSAGFGSGMCAPADVQEMCMYFGIKNREDFLVFINAFPETVALHMGWRVKSVLKAYEKAKDFLKENIDQGLLLAAARRWDTEVPQL